MAALGAIGAGVFTALRNHKSIRQVTPACPRRSLWYTGCSSNMCSHQAFISLSYSHEDARSTGRLLLPQRKLAVCRRVPSCCLALLPLPCTLNIWVCCVASFCFSVIELSGGHRRTSSELTLHLCLQITSQQPSSVGSSEPGVSEMLNLGALLSSSEV